MDTLVSARKQFPTPAATVKLYPAPLAEVVEVLMVLFAPWLKFISPLTSNFTSGITIVAIPIPTLPFLFTINWVPVDDPTTKEGEPAMPETESWPHGEVVPMPTLAVPFVAK